MKSILVILLFIALFVQSFSRSLVLADYLVNLKTYQKNCVNKAKPMLHCNGKCQMLKKMKKQEGENNANAPVPKSSLEELVLSSNSCFPSLFAIYANKINSYSEYHCSFSSSLIGSVFHPPTV